MHFVYILKSKRDGTLYTGITHNIKKRIKEHNIGISRYTKSRIPWIIIWCCVFPNKYIAAKFEKYLKTASGIAFINKRLIKKII